MTLTEATPAQELKTASDARSICSKHRVLFVEGSSGHGGSGSILLGLLRHLDRSRVSPLVATYSPTNARQMNEIRFLGIPFFALSKQTAYAPWATPFVTRQRNRWLRKLALLASWSYYWFWVQARLAISMARLIRKERVSAVLFNSDVHWHPAGILGAKVMGTPVIVRKAGGIGEGENVKKLLTGMVDVFVTVSQATHTDQMRSVHTKKAILIPEAVEVTKLASPSERGAARTKLRLPLNGVIVGSGSRIQEGKGHAELILAAAEVIEKRPDVLFYIAGGEDSNGNPHLLEDLRNLAQERGISDRVVFAGWRNDMEDVFAAMDVFVHCPTSFIEGFCMVNAEAMACGLPTIVSRNGGMTDVVVDGVTGHIVEPGDIDAFADAILDLIDHPGKMREMGQRARQRIADHFEIQNMARAYEELIEELCRTDSEGPVR